MSDNIAYEEYRLTLKHEIINGDKTYQLDEPLVVKYMYIAAPNTPTNTGLRISHAYLLNEMMEKMKHELIQRAVEND